MDIRDLRFEIKKKLQDPLISREQKEMLRLMEPQLYMKLKRGEDIAQIIADIKVNVGTALDSLQE